MMSDQLNIMFNEQLSKELESAYLYVGMSAYFYKQNLKGFANWFQIQAMEEMTHAQKFYTYIINNGELKLNDIKSKNVYNSSPLQLLEESLEHEKMISRSIHEIYEQTNFDKNAALFLQFFINEQKEEEELFNNVISKMPVDNNMNEIIKMDCELGQRELKLGNNEPKINDTKVI